MSDKRYEANIIRATAVEPANNLQATSAPGVWSIDEVVELQKKDKWPTVGNVVTNVEDVFSTFLYEGNGTAQNINNGINIGNNIAGSVDFDGTGDSLETSHSFGYGTADFTVEFWMYADTLNTLANIFDNRSGGSTGFMIGTDASQKMRFYHNSANLIIDSNTTSTGAWHHIAVARSSGTTKMFKNGTQIGSDYSDTNNYTSNVLEIGQRSVSDGLEFDGKLSNVRVVLGTAVYTSNFTPSTEPLTAISGTELLICTDNNLLDEGPNNISFTVKGDPTPSSSSPFTGNTGEGGLVWIKKRNAAKNHGLMDTEQGLDSNSNSRYLVSNLDQAQTTGALINSFNSNGFLVGGADMTNGNTEEYVSWTFRQAPKFFDVVKYTGNFTAGTTISHNLGQAPGMIIFKDTSNTRNWYVYHRSLGKSTFLSLDQTIASFSNTFMLNNTDPTSTEFTLGEATNTNANGATYIAYLFAHNDGDGEFGPNADQDIIKCGSFTSDGADTITLGFEPQWVIVKQTDGSAGWYIWDTMRGWQVGDVGNNNDPYIYANSSNAESDFTVDVGFPTATGFETKSFGTGEYIYMAIRRGPLAEPTSASDVFAISTYGQGGSAVPSYTSNFPVDMYFERPNNTAFSWHISSRFTGPHYMKTDSTAAEAADSSLYYDFMDGVYNGTGVNTAYYGWMWKRAPKYFDVVAYTGTGSTHNVSHNLGVVPEMMWVKRRDTSYGWYVYHKDIGNTKYLALENTDAEATGTGAWDSTTPTSSVFTVGTQHRTNQSGGSLIAYLFATLAGVSKVGSYTGNGSSQNIDCGFSNGAKFVLIKRTDGAGNWCVFDTTRGIVAGNDYLLKLNVTDAQSSDYDQVDPFSSGFTVVRGGQAEIDVNYSGLEYIFYAIAA